MPQLFCFLIKLNVISFKWLPSAPLKSPWFSAGLSKSRTGGSLESGPGSERLVGPWGEEVIEIKHWLDYCHHFFQSPASQIWGSLWFKRPICGLLPFINKYIYQNVAEEFKGFDFWKAHWFVFFIWDQSKWFIHNFIRDLLPRKFFVSDIKVIETARAPKEFNHMHVTFVPK